MSLILLSGGLDSALCLHLHGAEMAVAFDYGQPHLIELRYARTIARHYGISCEVIALPRLPLVDDIVFAGRNAAMLSFAAGIAQHKGIQQVLIGCNRSDAERFPDCRRLFLDVISRALDLAYGVTVEAPLLDMTKAEIVAEAKRLKLPETWTCYSPTIDNQPCGVCYSCKSLIS